MTKTERVIIVVGAGLVILAWLFGRFRILPETANKPDGRGAMLPPLGKVKLPVSNGSSTCRCPEAQTDAFDPGDFSQGGYMQPDGSDTPTPPALLFAP